MLKDSFRHMDFVNFYTIIISLLHYLYHYYYYMLHEKCNLIHDLLGMPDNSNVYLDKPSCFMICICDVHHMCIHVRNVTTWYLEKHLIIRRDNQRKPRIMER